MEPDD